VILENGLVRTLDAHVPTQRALAIAGEHIVSGVGVHETALASPEVVDLGDRVVVPGLTDARVFAGDDPRRALRIAAARGVTAIHTLDGLPFWAELDASGSLTLRVRQVLSADEMKAFDALGLRAGFGSPFLRVGVEPAPDDVYGSGRVLAEVDPLADLRAGVPFEAMTVRPAALTGERRGKLLPGYAADLVVLDRDPLTGSSAKVVATMVAGRWVHNPPPWREV
jgi:predicted amidohydrolase YtcJ